MKNLYIIGNGFDLWHGLPTKYSDFYEFVGSELSELEEYVCFEYTDGTAAWSNFEADLGSFDWGAFYSYHDNAPPASDDSFKPSMLFGVEDDLREHANELINNIQLYFREWIGSVDINKVRRQFNFISTEKFISFNYTSLLQDVYGIDDHRVFHIHGSANGSGDLIFGHGNSMEKEPEWDAFGDSNRTMYTDAEEEAKRPIYELKKPVDKILDSNREYFESLRDVDVVVVIGHSINDVDLPYFARIAKITNDIKWIVSKQTKEDEISHLKQLETCGIVHKNITTCSVDEIPKLLSHLL
jgi:hypothetical protein